MKNIKRLTTLLVTVIMLVGGPSTAFANTKPQVIEDVNETLLPMQEANAMKRSKVYETSPFFQKDYVNMEIINNEAIKIEGRTLMDKSGWMISVNEYDKTNIAREFEKIQADNTYRDTISLKGKLKEGRHYITIYFKEDQEDDGVYSSYHSYIPLEYENGELFFPISPIYAHNYLEFIKNSVVDPNNYLDINIQNESEKKEIIDLAHTITKDVTSDYDKLQKVNEWVSQNIYYDWDAYRSKKYGPTDAYGTLKAKKSVCQGYAELTQALLKAVGIPSRLVSGFANNNPAKHWDEIDHNKSNHAWNEAFVDGRWVILDTTWNSSNKYEGGKFQEETMKYRYFDPSLESFSRNHKILRVN